MELHSNQGQDLKPGRPGCALKTQLDGAGGGGAQRGRSRSSSQAPQTMKLE